MEQNDRVSWRTLVAFISLVVIVGGLIFYKNWDEKRQERLTEINACMARSPNWSEERCAIMIEAVDKTLRR
jgi:hypothetical protein